MFFRKTLALCVLLSYTVGLQAYRDSFFEDILTIKQIKEQERQTKQLEALNAEANAKAAQDAEQEKQKEITEQNDRDLRATYEALAKIRFDGYSSNVQALNILRSKGKLEPITIITYEKFIQPEGAVDIEAAKDTEEFHQELLAIIYYRDYKMTMFKLNTARELRKEKKKEVLDFNKWIFLNSTQGQKDD